MASVRYIVADIDRSVAFYTGLLGFDLAQQMGTAIALVERGDLRLWLSGPTSTGARALSDGRVPEPGGWNRLVLEVEDIETRVRALREAGAAFRNEIISGPGGRQAVVDDPDGNPVELFEAHR